MLCSVKDCTRIAKYLVEIKSPKYGRIRFELCEEHNKLKWKVEGE